MNTLKSDRGSQAILAVGLLAFNLALLLMIAGASSLLVQQRALNNYTDALALDLADWLRVNRDDPLVYPLEWDSTVTAEARRLLTGTTLQRLGGAQLADLQVLNDRTVSVQVCSSSWLGLGSAMQVCAESTATQG